MAKSKTGGLMLSADDIVMPLSANNYNARVHSDAHALDFGDEESLTQQQFKDDSDINVIVERWLRTNELPGGTLPITDANYGDFTGIGDYQSQLNNIIKANQMFEELPAKVRARFHNNPAAYVEFCSNPDNAAQARELGLFKPLPTPAKPVEVVVKGGDTPPPAKTP